MVAADQLGLLLACYALSRMERDVLPVICIQQPRGTHIWCWGCLCLLSCEQPLLCLVHWLICLPTNVGFALISWIRRLVVSWFLGAVHRLTVMRGNGSPLHCFFCLGNRLSFPLYRREGTG